MEVWKFFVVLIGYTLTWCFGEFDCITHNYVIPKAFRSVTFFVQHKAYVAHPTVRVTKIMEARYYYKFDVTFIISNIDNDNTGDQKYNLMFPWSVLLT